MNKFRKIGMLILVICLVHLAMPELASACPTCKDNLHDDGTAFAYAFSILFMMGMPFLILAFWVTTILRLRSKVARLTAENQHTNQLELEFEA
ncbi:MAG: hypothetical protein AB8B55_16890 [Mariniblastus sp.]